MLCSDETHRGINPDGSAIVARTMERVAELLHLPARPVRVTLVRNGRGARTRMARQPGKPHVFIGEGDFRPGIVAHELAHCLIPTNWLFAAEGFAVWAGSVVAGDCSDLWFEEGTVREVVRARRAMVPPLADMVMERQSFGNYLAPENFHRLTSRVAHAAAAASCEYWIKCDPLAASKIGDSSASLPELLKEQWGTLEGFETECRRWFDKDPA